MTRSNLSDFLVALFVIACSVVLLAALTFALSGYHLKKPTRTLQINYEDVTGIKVNSEVRYAGAPAGRVIAMRHLTAKEREASANKKVAVLVTVSLDEGIPPLPTDVTATLSSDTLLSPKNLWHFPRAHPAVRRWQTTLRSKAILLTAWSKSLRQPARYSIMQTS
ncbi:MAG: hypothetical protein DMF43_04260 [Verrucomicrobia bacterium]|nr:MAG: hypothetical protein DMF43_04260 [Verrucomicrobiota bacterium]